MFQSFINDAKAAAASVIGKYLARASVAVPFLIALGFGTMAVTLLLVDRFGATSAYAMMAVGFAAIGVVAALAVTVKEEEAAIEEEQAQEAATDQLTSTVAAQAATQVPVALLGALLGNPAGPPSLIALTQQLTQQLGRHIPPLLLVTVVALLLGPMAEPGPAADRQENQDDLDPGMPNGPRAAEDQAMRDAA